MRIHSITLRNFISHRETSIEFPDGLTAIIGRNGSGKTSILDAISYALFKEHSRGRDENLINRRADSAQIQLIFSSGGRRYEVTWRMGRRKRILATLRDLTSNSTIFVDTGEKTAVPEIEKIIGISGDIFINAAYVKQGEIAKLLEMRPAERKELISKLLGVDVLEKIWEDLRTPIGIIEERQRRYIEESRKLSEIEERLRASEEEFSGLRGKLGEIEVKQRELRLKLEETQMRIKAVEEKRGRYEQLKELLARVNQDIALRMQDLENKQRNLELVFEAEKRLEELSKIKEEYSSLEKEVMELEKTRENFLGKTSQRKFLTEKLREVKESIRSLESLISEYMRRLEPYSEMKIDEEKFMEAYSSTLKKLRKLESQLRDEAQELMKRMGENEGRREIHIRNIRELESGVNVCPLCKRPLSTDLRESIMKNLRKNIEELEVEVGELRSRVDEYQLKIEKVESAIKELSSMDPELFTSSIGKLRELKEEEKRVEEELKELAVIDEKLREIERLLDEKRKRLNDLRGLIEEYERERGVVEKLGSTQLISTRIHRLSSELRELEDEKFRLEAQLEALRYDPEEYNRLMDEVTLIHESLTRLGSEMASTTQRMKWLEEERARFIGEYESARKAAEKAATSERYLRSLKAIRECFGKDGVQRYVRAAARRSIEHYARKFLQFFTLTYNDLRLDEDYNVYVYGPMGEQSIDSLSGGEKTAIALCLRLGLATALTGGQLECIIMDEPTTHLDPERRRELIRLLTNFRRERGLLPQAIIVTHDVEVEEAADQVYHLTLKDGYSYLEEVQRI